MSRRPANSRLSSVSEWLRVAFAPFAWLGLALVLASCLALVIQVALPAGPDAGTWNPGWDFAEAQLPGVDVPEARALVEEARPRVPDYQLDWRAGVDGTWIVLAGPADRQDLLAVLRRTVGEAGHTPTSVGLGPNLARVVPLLLEDPSAIAEAVRAVLPLTLFGGGLVLLLLGAVLRKRLRAASPPAQGPTRSTTRLLLCGVALGLCLALCAEGLSAALAAFGHPIVEQPWVVQLLERRDSGLYAALMMIVFLAPLAEEVFFRGYLLEALLRGWGRVGSLLLSSAAFAAIHGHGPALPAYFMYAVGLGIAARRTGTLLVPITAHITVNALGIATLWWQVG